MGHLTYEQSKKVANKIIVVLAIITIFEVAFALLGKGHLVEGIHFPGMIMAFVMIVLSVVKAYLIIYEFMHMKYEVPGLVKSVLLPTLLLVWGIIAFTWEGDYWKKGRSTRIENKVEKTIGLDIHKKVDKQELYQIG